MAFMITKSGKWAQSNPALPQLTLVEGETVEKYPAQEVFLMVTAGWAKEVPQRGKLYFRIYKGRNHHIIIFGDPAKKTGDVYKENGTKVVFADKNDADAKVNELNSKLDMEQ